MLNVEDADVFDQWRANYDKMTSDEHLEFVEKCAAKFPSQVHFTQWIYERLFSSWKNLRVLEIGGWKGELACYCLSNFEIKDWTNIEICKTAVKNTVEMPNDKYTTICPDNFFWFRNLKHLKADLLISSNTIEHFSNNDFLYLVEAISDIRMVLFEAPLKNNGETWQGYYGTHILDMDWADVILVMDRHGYKPTKLSEICYLFIKR